MSKRFIVTELLPDLPEDSVYEVYDDLLEIVVCSALDATSAEEFAAWLEVGQEDPDVREVLEGIRDSSESLFSKFLVSRSRT